MARKMKLARPAARKTTGPRAKSARGGSSRQSKKAEPAQAVEAATPRRRFAELPKVQGELPTPTATFYF